MVEHLNYIFFIMKQSAKIIGTEMVREGGDKTVPRANHNNVETQIINNQSNSNNLSNDAITNSGSNNSNNSSNDAITNSGSNNTPLTFSNLSLLDASNPEEKNYNITRYQNDEGGVYNFFPPNCNIVKVYKQVQQDSNTSSQNYTQILTCLQVSSGQNPATTQVSSSQNYKPVILTGLQVSSRQNPATSQDSLPLQRQNPATSQDSLPLQPQNTPQSQGSPVDFTIEKQACEPSSIFELDGEE